MYILEQKENKARNAINSGGEYVEKKFQYSW